MATWATAVSRDGSWQYQLTDEDILWTARAVWGEVPVRVWSEAHALAVMWSMLQRFYLLRNSSFSSRLGTIKSSPPHKSFALYVRSYSQPVSPDWLNVGTTEERERRRLRQTTPWDKLPERVRTVVTAWAKGQKPPAQQMVGAVHWLATSVADQAGSDKQAVAIPGVRGNTFFCLKRSTCRWTECPILLKLAAMAGKYPVVVLAFLGSSVAALPLS